MKEINEEEIHSSEWYSNLYSTGGKTSVRVRIPRVVEGRVRNLLDNVLLYLRGFKEGAIPCMAVAALMLGGLWYGLLGLVPAHVQHPYKMIIIWGIYGVLMFFAYGVAYTRERQRLK